MQITRSKASEILKSAKPRKKHYTRVRRRLKELKKDENIVTLKANKGNATIVTNATEYNDKINCLRSDSSVYSKLSKNTHPMSIKMSGIFSKTKNY